MSYLFGKYPEVLLTVHAQANVIEKTTLSIHPKGFACTILGNPSKTLITALFDFLHQYAEGFFCVFPFDLDHLPPFTREVLTYLQTIPMGETETYRQVACQLGSPRAARAVGGACGRNPLPLLIPCHRVLSSNGIGGFSLGLEIKQKLLNFEKIS